MPSKESQFIISYPYAQNLVFNRIENIKICSRKKSLRGSLITLNLTKTAAKSYPLLGEAYGESALIKKKLVNNDLNVLNVVILI